MIILRHCRLTKLIGTSSVYERLSKPKTVKGCIFIHEKLFSKSASFSQRFPREILCNRIRSPQPRVLRNLATESKNETEETLGGNQQGGGGQKKISRKDQLKTAVRDYGATVIVFHVTISLMSLGICYLLISNGLDAALVLKAVGFSESIIASKVAVGGGTLVMAYAVHKLFAPLRIAITLSSTPFIVRYLRRAGVLKQRKS